MGGIISSYIFPHPPIIVPGIGGGREKEAQSTIDACKKAARMVYDDMPTTIIISTPHAPCFRDYIYISDTERLAGNFENFGHSEVSVDFENNASLAMDIIAICESRNISAGFISEHDKRRYEIKDSIDHGAMVPLYFIQQEFDRAQKLCKVVHISTPFLSLKELYEFGKCVQVAVENSNERVVYIASGDLSHRLSHDAPAGYTPKGRPYDEKLVGMIRNLDVKGILSIDLQEMEEAGECGTKSFVIMFGANDNKSIESEIMSYEGPFGVGYLVAKIFTKLT